MPTDRKVNYIELPGHDFDTIQAFYERTFGWIFTDYGPEYRAFTDGVIDGGFHKSEMRSTTSNGAVLVIMYATDLDQTLAAVKQNGGTIAKDIFSFPGGRRFQFLDPHGNELAVWSDKSGKYVPTTPEQCDIILSTAPDYLSPAIPRGLQRIVMPLVRATAESLSGYGSLVASDPEAFPIEIVRWPAQGWRPIDLDCGDEAGTTQGVFVSEWKGDVLYGSNEAVGGHYVLGYAVEPKDALEDHTRTPRSVMLWHANYHPDGGQLFYPRDAMPFVVPLALPGDDVKPEDFVSFWFDGTCGLYIHPNVWHEGVFATAGKQRFFDRQGAVHARVSVDFPREFACLLESGFDIDS